MCHNNMYCGTLTRRSQTRPTCRDPRCETYCRSRASDASRSTMRFTRVGVPRNVAGHGPEVADENAVYAIGAPVARLRWRPQVRSRSSWSGEGWCRRRNFAHRVDNQLMTGHAYVLKLANRIAISRFDHGRGVGERIRRMLIRSG